MENKLTRRRRERRSSSLKTGK